MDAADIVVDERHELSLRKILKLEPGPELPDDLKVAYFQFKAPADRCGYRLSDGDLIHIALQYAGSTDEHKPYSFSDLVKSGRVPPNARVTAEWRGKKVEGTFVKLRMGKPVVIVDDGSGEERYLNPAKVWLDE